MDLLFSVVLAWVATISVILLSVIYILRKVSGKNKDSFLYKINRRLRKQHKVIGVTALVSSLLHGLYSSLPILSGNKGTFAFVAIILLGLSFMFIKKLKGKWAKSHRALAALTCILVVLHVVEVGGFVGVDALVEAVEQESVVYATENDEDNNVQINDESEVATDVATEAVISNKNNEVLFDGLLLNDGTYYGSADAYGPDLETEVVVTNGLVVEVNVISHNEKKVSIYGEAMDTVPVAIVEEQSLVVDSISGATYTSYGIMMSVENALEAAVVQGNLPEIEMPSISRGKH